MRRLKPGSRGGGAPAKLPTFYLPLSPMEKRLLLEESLLNLILRRLAFQLIESHQSFEESVFIAIQPRGIELMHAVVKALEEVKAIVKPESLQQGTLDITFHRDDFRSGKTLIPKSTDIPFAIEGKRIILIDDVLYTGRTIRAALDALVDFGRPKDVELLVLIDRKLHRDLPIQAKYVGKTIDSIEEERVTVDLEGKVFGLPLKPLIMASLSTKHLLGIADLSTEDIQLIHSTADEFKEVLSRKSKKSHPFRDVTIANLFFENSTRTKISFELAEKRLSADVVNFASSTSSTKKGETLIDTVNNILAMKVDMVVMRHPQPGAHRLLSRHIDAKIINAGDGAHEHPTQALLDAYSIRERLGDVGGKKICLFGDIKHSPCNLQHSLFAKIGG